MKIPKHVGIIMDGNGRWAKQRGLKRTMGHERGAKVAEDVIQWASDIGIRYLTLYSFSTENWKRPKEEVSFLFSLMVRYLESRLNKIIRENVRVRFIGRIEELPENVFNVCKRIEEKSKNNSKIDVILAVNYGGRREIVDAVNNLISNNIKNITIEDLSKNLYLPDIPDPELIIRTSGEIRISNFLLWQIAYSELYFTDTLWPDFTKKDLEMAIKDFSNRNRRFGSISSDEGCD
ncbi:undecaprenyl diphosphate synthase [Marinitoga hydrogenitolerans DSM 16785]|uniref:Isoprenyl transferase n=1 Tax=Marinitoga hydrogenitolerans (strain DSM 16785 / JCM 12826 / AT1271) TaxID=1122195 RepID=A0A1M4U562_MARH1|nr:isoprenyl transferase [Marinitoga hydrogenitolerans]SHE51815.1 undecaprenyl diphosphate synthase [Marinitoga hydrogenitolerans DSM 16785]